ncbi:DUF4954 family protein [Dysgonomonas sp. HDW5A]|uniref:DUF4954 family protein n=1 Tax=unclassified Dysgonomonas TaxID=2630389 RepID=UPI00140E7B88|nr:MULTISPECIES: DUF4954 family protein [unclassified Dysgonomonas]QIK53956.1 DUF4954 family protein [Dysgonomonas sp. HDW5B]QIK59405.1 DUF4954 family protein [Dysgonomonas sp. HDW5A]
MEYRKLTESEILALQSQGCACDNWDNVSVHHQFNTTYICQVNFSGEIKLGVYEKEFTLPGGIKKHSGIKNVTLHNCEIGNNTFISDVNNYIANYKIGDNVFIHNLELMYVDHNSSFGNGIEVTVLNETGGREVIIHDNLSASFAYIMSFYRHRPVLIHKMQEIVKLHTQNNSSSIGTIGNNVKIINTGTIKNVRIHDYATIESTCHLENGTINSNEYDPVHIGYNVMAKDFIISSGSHVEDGTMLTRCFVGQACQLGHTYSASDSLFFSNCQGENGEACAIFAGPYTVTHHKSTLLISGMYSFMNAGSGSNQSNHMYKLGPIHQGVMERGGKTASDSYILWPAKIGAFSLVMGRHYRNSDTSKMPFSYLIEHDDETVLVPGVNLRSVGTIRDAQKFPKRDKRKDPHKLDQINFNLLSPYTVQKMFQGIEVLNELLSTCGEASVHYTYRGCRIKGSSLRSGLKYYDIAITKFLGNSIISRLSNCPCSNDEEIREYLKPDSDAGLDKWRDLAGLLAPSTEIDKLIDDIESDRLTCIKDINAVFERLHKDYYSLEWTWAWDKIQEYFNLSLETITAKDIISIVERWKEAVVKLDWMIYEDARKEFSLPTHTSFGMDGDKKDQKIDFEQVRGIFEKNSFVEAVLEHIKVKSKLGEDMIERLSKSI